MHALDGSDFVIQSNLTVEELMSYIKGESNIISLFNHHFLFFSNSLIQFFFFKEIIVSRRKEIYVDATNDM